MDDLGLALRDANWRMVEEALPRGFRERAVALKLIKADLPPQLGAKVTEVGIILRMILFKVATNAALTTVVASFAAAKVIELSAVTLHNWLVKTGGYLGELVKQLVAEQAYDLQKRHWAGFELVLVDATCVQRPGATTTTARVHRALRIPDLRIVEFVLTDEHGGETFRNFATPKSGQLWIADRGYANPPGIAWMVAHGAAVLVRHNRGSLPLFDAKGQRFDVEKKLLTQLQTPLRPRQWIVFVHAPDGSKIRGAAVRRPPAHREGRRRARTPAPGRRTERHRGGARDVRLRHRLHHRRRRSPELRRDPRALSTPMASGARFQARQIDHRARQAAELQARDHRVLDLRQALAPPTRTQAEHARTGAFPPVRRTSPRARR